jgi:nucleotide-binding universal stress UspA family protein
VEDGTGIVRGFGQGKGAGMLNLEAQRRPKSEGFGSFQLVEEDPQPVGREPQFLAGAPDSIPKLRNIVAATDLSVGGSTAMMAGAVLAERNGAKLSVVSIVQPPNSSDLPQAADPGISEWVDSQQDRVRRRVEIELDRASLPFALVHVGVGEPARLVAAFAERLRADLVVVGAHRLSRFERVLEGSTGEEILRHSRRPVMVATRDGAGRFRRILVAVDLSRNSQAVLETAMRLARGDASEVQVVYAEEPSKGIWRRIIRRDSRTRRQADRRRFEGMVGECQFPGEHLATVLRGHAGRAVLGEARRWNADLIVMGVRRSRLLCPTRLGRTSRYVLRRGDRSIVAVST